VFESSGKHFCQSLCLKFCELNGNKNRVDFQRRDGKEINPVGSSAFQASETLVRATFPRDPARRRWGDFFVSGIAGFASASGGSVNEEDFIADHFVPRIPLRPVCLVVRALGGQAAIDQDVFPLQQVLIADLGQPAESRALDPDGGRDLLTIALVRIVDRQRKAHDGLAAGGGQAHFFALSDVSIENDDIHVFLSHGKPTFFV
jgi:hypothetical protein